jgi:hypothetical protein
MKYLVAGVIIIGLGAFVGATLGLTWALRASPSWLPLATPPVRPVSLGVNVDDMIFVRLADGSAVRCGPRDCRAAETTVLPTPCPGRDWECTMVKQPCPAAGTGFGSFDNFPRHRADCVRAAVFNGDGYTTYMVALSDQGELWEFDAIAARRRHAAVSQGRLLGALAASVVTAGLALLRRGRQSAESAA